MCHNHWLNATDSGCIDSDDTLSACWWRCQQWDKPHSCTMVAIHLKTCLILGPSVTQWVERTPRVQRLCSHCSGPGSSRPLSLPPISCPILQLSYQNKPKEIFKKLPWFQNVQNPYSITNLVSEFVRYQKLSPLSSSPSDSAPLTAEHTPSIWRTKLHRNQGRTPSDTNSYDKREWGKKIKDNKCGK